MAKKIRDEDDVQLSPLSEYNMDELWAEYTTLHARFTRLAADAKKELEEAKSNLEVVKCEVDQEIRRNPDEFDLPKATEGSIASTIPLQPEYKQAIREVIQARHKSDIFQGMVSTLEYRKSGLGKMVDLWIAGYFGERRPKHKQMDEAVQEAEKRQARKKARVRRDQ